MDKCEADSTTLVGAGPRVLNTMKSLKDVRQLFFGNADPCIDDGQLHVTADTLQGDFDFSVEGEFERVGDEIQQDFFPHLAVDVDKIRNFLASYGILQAGLVHGRAENARNLFGDGTNVDRLVDGLDSPCLDPRKIEQGVHEL